ARITFRAGAANGGRGWRDGVIRDHHAAPAAPDQQVFQLQRPQPPPPSLHWLPGITRDTRPGAFSCSQKRPALSAASAAGSSWASAARKAALLMPCARSRAPPRVEAEAVAGSGGASCRRSSGGTTGSSKSSAAGLAAAVLAPPSASPPQSATASRNRNIGSPPWWTGWLSEGRIHDGERLRARHEGDAAQAEQRTHLLAGDVLARPGRRGGAGRGLREGRGARRVEADVALHLLHDLVDVAVQHGDRAEALQVGERPLAVLGVPAPFGVDGPQGDVRVDDDRRAAAERREVVFQPLELLVAEHTSALALEAQRVHQADEVDAAV